MRKTLDNSARVENFKYRNSNKKSTVEKLQELKIVGEVEKSVLSFQIYYCREGIGARKTNIATRIEAKYG